MTDTSATKKPRKPRAKKAAAPAPAATRPKKDKPVPVSKARVELLGHFWVDSGTVSVGDPGYLSGRENPFRSWGAFCDSMFGKDSVVVNPEQGAGSQVVFRTPDGDGKFPVYGVYNDAGELVRVTISFGKKSEVQ